MKRIFSLIFILFTLYAYAQDDCQFFFPKHEGEVVTRGCYNAKGVLQNTIVYKVNHVLTYPSGDEADVSYSFNTASGETIYTGKMVARCVGGEFTVSMEGNISFPIAMQMLNANISLAGDMMNYLKAETPPNKSNTISNFKDATLRLYQKDNKANRAEVLITNRGFAGNDILHTPVGEIECTRIKYDFYIWTPHESEVGYAYEWYAPDLGIVRSEEYNQKDELQSYTDIISIKY